MSTLSQFFAGGGADPWVSGTTYAAGKVVLSPADNYQSYVRVIAGAGTTDPSADATNWKPMGARAIKSIQRGVITTTGAGATSTTISSVNPAKTELRYLGNNPASATSINEGMVYVVLTNATTVTAGRATTFNSNQALVSWELTEYF